MKQFAFIAALALCGCGKKAEQPVAATSEPVVEASAEMPAPGLPANFVEQMHGTVNPEMTMRLRLFVQHRGRMPENFYELQNMPGFDSVPPLPLNMKYVIDPKDKTVKAVKK